MLFVETGHFRHAIQSLLTKKGNNSRFLKKGLLLHLKNTNEKTKNIFNTDDARIYNIFLQRRS